MIKSLHALLLAYTLYSAPLSLHILGSGGPEIDGLASSSIVLAEGGDAKILIDCGSGAMLRFEEAGFTLEHLSAVLITHLHIDHVVDLPSFMKAGYFSQREEPLVLLGPDANQYFPSITEFVQRQFGKHGAYMYMQDILTNASDSFTLQPHIAASNQLYRFNGIQVQALKVHHGIVPALAYKISYRGKQIVITGDTNDEDKTLAAFAKGADYLIVNSAIASNASSIANSLHISPTDIVRVAKESHAKHLILTHHMHRTLRRKHAIMQLMQHHLDIPVFWADDLSSYTLLDN